MGTGLANVSDAGSGFSVVTWIVAGASGLSNPRRWRTFYITSKNEWDGLRHRERLLNELRALGLAERAEPLLLDMMRGQGADFVGNGAPGLQRIQIQNNMRI